MTKLVREYRVTLGSLRGQVYVEFRNVGDDSTSGPWKQVKKQREYWLPKNFRSTNMALKYINSQVDLGRGIWEGRATEHFEAQEKKEQQQWEQELVVFWTDEEWKRLQFAKWLVERGILNEEVAEGVAR